MMIRSSAVAIALAMAGSAAWAQTPAPLAFAAPQTDSAGRLVVSSADFADGGAIPLDNSGYGASRSPALSWTAGPAGTRSYALMVEDAEAVRDGLPILHWMVYNIPVGVAALPEGVPAGADLDQPVRLSQGPNVAGQPAYRGPHPPSGEHHYHVEVFALDVMLPPIAGRNALVDAMRGHVLAKGELIGRFAKPADH
jgi:Raf kinase inhibitor-like YbhB/YbcL family protein